MTDSGRILYLTDKRGISSGYRGLFHTTIMKAGFKVSLIINTHIYNAVPNPLKRKGQKQWRLNPEYYDEVKQAIDKLVVAIQPRIIVCSDTAALGVFADESSIELTRGSVYEYAGIPVLITYPINSVHTKVDRKKRGQDTEAAAGILDYTVKAGSWIILNDWKKAHRIYTGTQRYQPPFHYTVCRTLALAKRGWEFLQASSVIAVDYETRHKSITSIQYTGLKDSGEIHTWVFPFWDAFRKDGCYWNEEAHHDVWEYCRQINDNDAIKIAQNGTYDASWSVRWRIPFRNYLMDTTHLWHSLYPELPKKLGFLASICCDNYQHYKDDLKGIDNKDETKRDKDMERYWRYGALDPYYTMLSSRYILFMVMQQPWAQHNYVEEFGLALAYWHQSMRGLATDQMRRVWHLDQMLVKQEKAVADFKVMVDDPEFNVNSPAQVKQLIYETLGARPRKVGGKSGSTGEPTLKLIRTEHPIFKIFIDGLWAAKKPGKSISDFIEIRQYTSRVRTKMSPAGTETWRCNSKSSDFWDGRNLQNLPEKFRDWFIADPGYVYVNIDYSQSDAIFVAFESEDPKYIDTMGRVVSEGYDSHSFHAAHFFKSNYQEVIDGYKRKDPKYYHPTRGIRPLTKRVVHGANFQMAARTLYHTMGKEAVIGAAIALGFADAGRWKEEQYVKLCGVLIQGFHQLYPGLKIWYDEIATALTKSPMLANAFGMTRTFFGAGNDPATQREATAFYGQSGTAGNINRSVLELRFGIQPRRFRDADNPWYGDSPFCLEKQGGQLLLQVHDSLLMQLPRDNYIALIDNTCRVMERPFIIKGREVVVPTDVKIGLRWGENMLEYDRQNPTTLDEIDGTWELKDAA